MNHPLTPIAGRPKSRASVYVAFASAFVLASALTGCGEGTVPKNAARASTTSSESAGDIKATWLPASSALAVSGTATPLSDVSVRNADSKAVVARTKASASGAWSVTATLPSAPCQVATSLDTGAPTAAVTGATNCTGGTSRAATARLIRANAVVAPNPAAPNGTIVSPASPVRLPGATGPNAITINAGTSLKFAAVGTDPNNNTPLTYLWDFNGAAPNSNVQNPGAISFSKVGAYFVKLTVANSLGIPDPTPSERVIVVQNATGNSTQATALSASITSPVGNQTIAVGSTVNFNATATGGTPFTNGQPPYNFVWNFGGAIPNVAAQTPGSVTFAKAGTFPVRLTVTDSTGAQNPTPLEVVISVQNTVTSTNQPPTGIIRSPKTDLKIVSGDQVFFQATAIDPDNNLPITYAWDFAGATVTAAQNTAQNPGLVKFTLPAGVASKEFHVKMVAKDAAGAVDLNPPVRHITVQSNATATATAPVIDPVTFKPNADLTIDVHTKVTFDAMASSPDNNPLEHLWTFAGVAPDATISGPIDVTFDTAGEYLAVYTVTDTVNLLSTSIERLIIVGTPPVATPGTKLEAEIDSPRGRVKIQAGEMVDFAGSFESNDPAITEVTYAWEFEGGDPATSIEQTPGPVAYLEPGHFVASLIVTDANGNSSEPETKHVLVGDPADTTGGTGGTGGGTGGGAPATRPTVTIDSPAGDTIIMVGQSLEFMSTATDPNGLALTYEWDFGGGMAGSTAEDPGSVTFDAVGTYHVRLVVTNEAGKKAKAHVVITVEDVPPTPPAVPAPATPVP